MKDTLVKRRKTSSGLKSKIIHERAKIYKSLFNMVKNKLEKYRPDFKVKGEIIPIPHDNLSISHETGFAVLKVSFLPLGSIPTHFAVFCHENGKTECTEDLDPKNLEIAFDDLLASLRS